MIQSRWLNNLLVSLRLSLNRNKEFPMQQLMQEENSLDTIMDGMSIDEAIAYLQSLKTRFVDQKCVLSNDCVDDITGVTALNLYAIDET
jgi:hypothetical protein